MTEVRSRGRPGGSGILDLRDDIALYIGRFDGRRVRCRPSGPPKGQYVLLALPTLIDIDSARIKRICRLDEIETAGCLSGEADDIAVGGQEGSPISWIDSQASGDDQHLRRT